jgi:hypothetical protein
MQEIALVLGCIHGAEQPIAVVAKVDARVMAGGDLLRAQGLGVIEEGLELDLAIA